MSGSGLRVMIIDDNAMARQGIRTILESDPSFEVVAEGSSGEEALRLSQQWMPDLILMDIQMPGMGGLQATKRLKEQYPYIKVVIVTVADDIVQLFEAWKMGAQGYLQKNLQPEAWRAYLHAIVDDEVPMTRDLALGVLKEMSPLGMENMHNDGLTEREGEVLKLVVKGYSNKGISQKLSISEHTVKNHMKNILQKLQLENRVQLVRYAYEQGWMR